MKKNINIIFLVPYPQKVAPGQRFRFEQYLSFFMSRELEYRVLSFLDNKAYRSFYEKGNPFKKILTVLISFLKRINHLFIARHADYIYIYREASPLGPPIFEWILAKVFRKKIIYDFDDSIWLSDPTESPLTALIKWKSKVGNICRWSYKVNVGNEYLAKFASQYNQQVIIIPTVINTETYVPQVQTSGELVIGWTGSHSTLIYVKDILPVVKKLRQKYKFRFLIIANQPPSFDEDFIDFIKWDNTTEVNDLKEIQIGLMPLTNTPWSSGKCGLKILQYQALGIPAIASDVGVNATIIQHGSNGFICRNEVEWLDCLEKLINDPALRKSIGEKGRASVLTQYSVEATADQFFALFTD